MTVFGPRGLVKFMTGLSQIFRSRPSLLNIPPEFLYFPHTQFRLSRTNFPTLFSKPVVSMFCTKRANTLGDSVEDKNVKISDSPKKQDAFGHS